LHGCFPFQTPLNINNIISNVVGDAGHVFFAGKHMNFHNYHKQLNYESKQRYTSGHINYKDKQRYTSGHTPFRIAFEAAE
jgi:hypothetical protein